MTAKQKSQLLLFLGLASVMVIIIAAGLTHLVFQPGMPLPSLTENGVLTVPAQENAITVITISKLVKVIIGILFACLQVFIIYKLIKGVPWREILSVLLDIFIIVLMVGTVLFLIVSLLPEGEAVQTAQEVQIAEAAPVVRSPLGPVPPSLLWVVGIILGIVCILVAFWIVNSVLRKKDTIDLLQWEAEKAYQAILSGQDFKNVILKCYHQMSEALKHERGIEREYYMTTGEFERLLKKEGIPVEPIHKLTSLFEVVRYGNQQPSRQEEQSAIECLSAIIHYCEELQHEN